MASYPTPSRFLPAVLILIGLGGLPTLRAQSQTGDPHLLFTTLVVEEAATSTYSGGIDTFGWAHTEIAVNDIHSLQYASGPTAVAPAFMPHLGLCELIGDNDGDGRFYESDILGAIDALVPPRTMQGGHLTLQQTGPFYSPTVATPSITGAILRPGEVGRFVPGGALEHLYTVAQLRPALGFPHSVLNVDAAALCPVQSCGRFVGYDLFLSFEETVVLQPSTSPMLVKDGGVVRVPYDALTWTASSYDGAALITAMDAFSAEIAYSEADIDNILRGTFGVGFVSNATGAAVTSIGDLDGLTSGPEVVPGSGGPCPPTGSVLWFTGTNLTGCGVVTTDKTIAVLDTDPLGSPATPPWITPTDGTQMGLMVTAGTLNALARAPDGPRIVTLDCLHPQTGGSGAQIDVGIAPAMSSTLIVMWNFGCGSTSCVDGPTTTTTWFSFPHLFVPTSGMSAASLGTASEKAGDWSSSWAPPIPGSRVVVQVGAYNSFGNFLSNPIFLEY